MTLHLVSCFLIELKNIRKKENLDVVALIPLDRIMLETDCPWCEVRPTHAGYSLIETSFPTKKDAKKWAKDHLIKGRSEPCQIVQIAEIVAKVMKVELSELSTAAFDNSKKLLKF